MPNRPADHIMLQLQTLLSASCQEQQTVRLKEDLRMALDAVERGKKYKDGPSLSIL